MTYLGHCRWLLVLFLLVQPAKADSHDGEGGSQDRGYYNNYDNNDQNDNDNGNFFSRAADRLASDMSSMWTSAPNEWVLEYWEVFVVIAGVAFFLLALHCCIVYDMCCARDASSSERAHAGGRLPLTTEQFLEQRRRQRIMKQQQQQEKGEALLGTEQEQEQQLAQQQPEQQQRHVVPLDEVQQLRAAEQGQHQTADQSEQTQRLQDP